MLPDGTMVSGDAAGGVQFWDARLGTRLASFHKHAADVLTLAAAPEGNAVFASGVDNQLAAFKLVTGQKGAYDLATFGSRPTLLENHSKTKQHNTVIDAHTTACHPTCFYRANKRRQYV